MVINQIISVHTDEVDAETLSSFRSDPDATLGKSYADYNIVGDHIHFLVSPSTLQRFHASALIYPLDQVDPRYTVCLPITCGFSLKDYQAKTVDHIYTTFHEGVTTRALVDLEPGAGKSYIASETVSRLGLRPVMIVKPTYVQKWVDDFHFYYGDDIRILVVNSQRVYDTVLAGIDPYDVIVITTNLITSVLKLSLIHI